MSRSISRISLAFIAVVVIVGGAAYAYYALQPVAPQQATPAPKPIPQPAPAPALVAPQKIKAIINSTAEAYYLVMEVGKEKGFWSSNGLDPEFFSTTDRVVTAQKIKDMVGNGTKMGYSATTEVFRAKADGVPVKIVASYTGEVAAKLLVKPDAPIKTVQDLNGKKFGVVSATSAQARQATYLGNKLSIKIELVADTNFGNLTKIVDALKSGKIDAFIDQSPAALKMVDSGELRILAPLSEFLPKPWAGAVVWASDDMIQQNPELVKRFVKATLDGVKYLKENPSYAADTYIRRCAAGHGCSPRNIAKNVAEKTIGNIDWRPTGRGSGQDLGIALTNVWQWNKDVGGIPASVVLKVEDAIDIRFVP